MDHDDRLFFFFFSEDGVFGDVCLEDDANEGRGLYDLARERRVLLDKLCKVKQSRGFAIVSEKDDKDKEEDDDDEEDAPRQMTAKKKRRAYEAHRTRVKTSPISLRDLDAARRLQREIRKRSD